MKLLKSYSVATLLASLAIFQGAAQAQNVSDDNVNHTIPDELKSSLKPSEVRVFGKAPNAKWQLVSDKNAQTYLIVMGKNDDIIAGLNSFAKSKEIKGAQFSAIGGVGATAIGFYEKSTNVYQVTKIAEQAELVAFSGNIATNKDGKVLVHAHGVVAKNDSKCLGGHMLYASAWPTVEIMLTVTEKPMEKFRDESTGLSFYKPTESCSAPEN